MAAKIGLWIDHRRAVIMTLKDNGVNKQVIKSDAERHARAAGDPNLTGPHKDRIIPADDRLQNEFTEHLKIYYNQITDAICMAESILIFGPGEAKKELKKHLEKNNLGGRIAAVETCDEMTDNQILARVCKYFNVPVPADQDLVESPHQRMKTA